MLGEDNTVWAQWLVRKGFSGDAVDQILVSPKFLC